MSTQFNRPQLIRIICLLGLGLVCLALLLGSLFLSSPAMAAPLAVATPVGAQPLGAQGGTFNCGTAKVTVPANVVPNGGYIHCGSFDPDKAPAAPSGYKLLRHTFNINIYNNQNQWITYFNPPLTICYTYSDAELAAAPNGAASIQIMTAPINGIWSVMTSQATPQTKQVCAKTDHLTLFDLALASPVAGSPSGVGTPSASTNTYVTFAYSYKYTVKPGDTLFRIALNFGTSVYAIQVANNLPYTFIYAGEVLLVPTNVKYTGLPSTVGVPTVAPAATAKPGATSAARTYTVQAGDNLFRIALRFNVSLAALKAANGLTSNLIFVGQVLIIPGK